MEGREREREGVSVEGWKGERWIREGMKGLGFRGEGWEGWKDGWMGSRFQREVGRKGSAWKWKEGCQVSREEGK